MQPSDAPRPTRSPPDGSQRLLRGLVVVLALWGIYLAVGATGVFTDVGLLDVRRSAIVLACSATFLGAWMLFLARRGRPPAPRPDPTSLNSASRASLLTILLAYGLWAGAWGVWFKGNPMNLTFVLGWISLALFAVSAILAIIGLSDPLRERGKLWGLVTLALFLLAGAGFILQVRHYTEQQGVPKSVGPRSEERSSAEAV